MLSIRNKPLLTRGNTITLLAFLWLFILMVGYYIVKPVRSALLNELPHEALPYLFIGVMFLSLFANFFYDLFARLLSSSNLIIFVTSFCASVLCAFSFIFRMEWPSVYVPFLGVQPGRYIWIVSFFLFVGVYNVFTVTIFWSFVNEIFSLDEARNNFGRVTAGGTIGGILGSFITSYLVSRVQIGNLLFFSVAFLLFTLLIMKFLLPYRKETAVYEEGSGVKVDDMVDVPAEKIHESGFKMIVRYPYLRWMLLAMFLMTSSSTILSYQMNYLVKYTILDEVARTEFWANMNLLINIFGLFFQLFVIKWVVQRFGIMTTILVAPVVDILGCSVFITSHGLISGGFCHVGRYSTQYSFNRASREMLYTPTSRGFKYQAKAIIDTFIFRAGDGLTSILLIFIKSWSLGAMAGLNLCVNLLRIIPAVALARHYRVMINDKLDD